MFSYCEESPLTINIMIGQFISHELEWFDEKGNFVTIEKVNQWNQQEMAIEFFEGRYQNYLSKFGDIKNKATLEDLDMLEQVIFERRKELRQ